MKLVVMNREHVVICGLSSAWVEAHKEEIEDCGVTVNQHYMPGTDVVEFNNPFISSLDLFCAMDYVSHNCFSDYFWIGKDPMTTYNTQYFFFPCSQDVLVSYNRSNYVYQFTIDGILEDAVAFYLELLDALQRHAWLAKADFTTSTLGSVTIYLEFDYENDFIDFFSYLTYLDGIYLSVKFDGGDD